MLSVVRLTNNQYHAHTFKGLYQQLGLNGHL